MTEKTFTQFSCNEEGAQLGIQVSISSTGSFRDRSRIVKQSAEANRKHALRYSKTDAGKIQQLRYRKSEAGKNARCKATAKYSKTNAGKNTVRKSIAKRNRMLGWVPLNFPEEGYEAHHISKTFVVFIPGELHRSVSHNLRTGKNMDEINQIALMYLLPGVDRLQ